MKFARFHVEQARDGSWRWNLAAKNGRILCSGEGHTRKQDAVRATQTVRRTILEMERLYGDDRR